MKALRINIDINDRLNGRHLLARDKQVNKPKWNFCRQTVTCLFKIRHRLIFRPLPTTFFQCFPSLTLPFVLAGIRSDDFFFLNYLLCMKQRLCAVCYRECHELRIRNTCHLFSASLYRLAVFLCALSFLVPPCFSSAKFLGRYFNTTHNMPLASYILVYDLSALLRFTNSMPTTFTVLILSLSLKVPRHCDCPAL